MSNMPLPPDALACRDELLGLVARTLAHEASNLLFLEQILADAPHGSKPGAGQNVKQEGSSPRAAAVLPPEFRRSLAFLRKMARALSCELLDSGQPCVTTGADFVDDWAEMATRIDSFGVGVKMEFDSKARAAAFRERAGRFELFLYQVVSTAARFTREANPTAELLISGIGEERGIIVTVMRTDGGRLPPLSPWASAELDSAQICVQPLPSDGTRFSWLLPLVEN